MGGCSLRIWLQKDAYIVLGKGGGRGGRKHPSGAGFGNSKSHVSVVCRQVHLHLSTDALRLKVLGSGQGFLSTGRPSSVDRGYVNGLKAIPFDLQRFYKVTLMILT